MTEALDVYRANCDSVVFTTQVAIGIITGFVAASAVLISILAVINFRAAAASKEELEKLKKELKIQKTEFLDELNKKEDKPVLLQNNGTDGIIFKDGNELKTIIAGGKNFVNRKFADELKNNFPNTIIEIPQ